jgi:hypothetical protein
MPSFLLISGRVRPRLNRASGFAFLPLRYLGPPGGEVDAHVSWPQARGPRRPQVAIRMGSQERDSRGGPTPALFEQRG